MKRNTGTSTPAELALRWPSGLPVSDTVATGTHTSHLSGQLQSSGAQTFSARDRSVLIFMDHRCQPFLSTSCRELLFHLSSSQAEGTQKSIPSASYRCANHRAGTTYVTCSLMLLSVDMQDV
jgi:hypothetical protein